MGKSGLKGFHSGSSIATSAVRLFQSPMVGWEMGVPSVVSLAARPIRGGLVVGIAVSFYRCVVWWTGWLGGSVGRALNSRSKYPGFKPGPVRSTRKMCERFSESKMLCWLAVGVPNPRVYTHSYEWSRTHVKDHVIHVRVRWITETRKDTACTCSTG